MLEAPVGKRATPLRQAEPWLGDVAHRRKRPVEIGGCLDRLAVEVQCTRLVGGKVCDTKVVPEQHRDCTW